MKKNGKIIVAAAVLVVLIAVFAGIYFGTRPATAEGAKTITVEVVYQDASSKTFTYQTDAEYLGQVLVDEGLVEGEDSQYGLMITVVDGQRADYSADGAYWAFYVGDEYAAQGVDATPIADGDTFRLVYTVG